MLFSNHPNMKHILSLFILSFIFAVLSFAQPAITGVLVPQYMADTTKGTGEGPRTPYVYRAKITGLTAYATYRYRSQAICLNYSGTLSDGATSAGAGNEIFVRQSGNFGYSSSASLSTAGGYDSLVANASGEYEGWFGVEPTSNARFAPGNYIHGRLLLNSGVTGNTTSSYYLTVSDSSKTIAYGTGTTQGTGIYGKSLAADRNFAVLWDNVFGTGRPLGIAIIENDGIAFRSATTPTNYPLYYRNNVDSISGAWGTIIPNSNAAGIRRIENRKLTDGSVYYANFDADGIWPTGAISTINPAGGYTAIKLDSSDVPLVPMPTFYFDQNTYSVNENGTSVTVSVKYKNPTFINTTIDVSVKAGGTAIAGSDFTLSTTTLTFTPTDTIKSLTIPIINDAIAEVTETFILVLSNPSNSGLVRFDSITTVTILDDDIIQAALAATKQTVSEGAASVTVTVKLSAPAISASSVSISANAATASSADFTFTSTTLNFAIGDSVKTSTVTIIDDALIEGNEYFVMQISNPSNLTLGNAVDTITITDNDFPRLPIGQISTVNNITGVADSLGKKYDIVGTVYGINYRPAGLQFVLRDNTGGITVFKTTGSHGYTVKEGDSLRVLGTVAQFNGLTEFNSDTLFVLGTNKQIKTPTVVTKLVESNENDLVRINNVQFNTAITTWPTVATNISVHNATDTIVIRLQLANSDILGKPAPAGSFDIIGLVSQFDATNPYTSGYQLFPRFFSDIIPSTTNASITIDVSPVTVSESVGTVQVKLKINNINGVASTINITNTGTATSGTDYTPPAASFSFPSTAANGDSIMVTYTIIDDALPESAETIIASFSAGANATIIGASSKTITITDNDPTATITIDTIPVSVSEAAGVVKIRLKINGVNGIASSLSLSNGGTATSGTDYTPPASTITFPATSLNGDSIILNYTIIDDALIESNETIIASFTGTSNATIIGGVSKIITILDNDAPAVLTIDTSSITVNENAGTVKVKVKINNVAGKIVTANLSFSGTATNGSDYTPPAATITFPATALNGDSIMLVYSITDDAIYEPIPETIITTFTPGLNSIIGGGSTQTTRIVDNDPNGINGAFSTSSIQVYPNPSNGRLTIKSTEELKNVTVFDLMGNEVQSLAAVSNTLNLEILASGLYIIVVQTNSGVTTQRVIVK